jgi:cysteine desulfurase family protein (TIGR01976 family)
MVLDLERIRQQFPSVRNNDAVFLDNPGGTQITQRAINRVNDYLLTCNANHGGAFRTSRESDQLLYEAHCAVADFINAPRPEEVIFGTNMTSLTFAISRSLGRTLRQGDEIIVTRLDHDANISPWRCLEQEYGIHIKWADIREEDVTLDMEQLTALISERTRLVACCWASNAVGSVVDVRRVADAAHRVGALCFVDAVHYAPHGPIDVQLSGCDFLVCSVYKFFGPHVGFLYGRHDLLEQLPAFKVKPADSRPPGKFETGTLNHEGIAGALGAIEYLQWLGETFGSGSTQDYPLLSGRRLALKRALHRVREYERELSRRLIEGLTGIPKVKIWGISSLDRLDRRVPTVSLTVDGRQPRELALRLSEAGIYAWDGNFYAVELMERLNLQESGGTLRLGLVHYNTAAEIDRTVETIRTAAECR